MIKSETAAEYNVVSTIPLDKCPTLSERDKKTIARAIKLLGNHLQQVGDILDCPRAVKDYLILTNAAKREEAFTVLYLDNRHRVIECVEHFHGTIDGAAVYPRVIVTHALRVNAAAVIFAHNHPSGYGEPSDADRKITDRLKTALDTVEVRVLDHLIIAGVDTFSFAEKGLI